MDMISHIIIADILLKKLNRENTTSVYSMLPMFDNKPLHYHRMYFHALNRLPTLARVGKKYFGGNIDDSVESPYEINRFIEEEPNIRRYILNAEQFLDHFINIEKCSNCPPEEICMSLLSHLYVDIFNNPVQPFTPEIVYPTGKWTFWNQLDWELFRVNFYQPTNLKQFHVSLKQSLNEINNDLDNSPEEIILDMLVVLYDNIITPQYVDKESLSPIFINKIGDFLTKMNISLPYYLEDKINEISEKPTMLKDFTSCIEMCMKNNLEDLINQ